MFRFLSKNLYEIEPDAFGLDISDESFKFAQLRTRGGNAKLVAFGFGDFPKGLITDGEIKDEQATADILAAALRKPVQRRNETLHEAELDRQALRGTGTRGHVHRNDAEVAELRLDVTAFGIDVGNAEAFDHAIRFFAAIDADAAVARPVGTRRNIWCALAPSSFASLII